MISESQWRVIKHQDLAMFSRPRLDLVIHIVIKWLIPRVQYNLTDLLGNSREGHGRFLREWQKDLRKQWRDMSKPDPIRYIERSLTVLKLPANTHDRTERLAQIRQEAGQPRGNYHINLNLWTCSCPAFLVSRFLLCKHLVRATNNRLGTNLNANIDFFISLKRNHTAPYYEIKGVNTNHDNKIPDLPTSVTRKVLRYTSVSEADTSEVEVALGDSQSSRVGLLPVRLRNERHTGRSSRLTDVTATAYDGDGHLLHGP
jgi:hypothetical protein